MFTGIVTGIGTVREAAPLAASRDMRLVIATPVELPAWADTPRIAPGASIACSGCCLTAVALGPDWFAVTVSAETLARTTLGGWRVGTRLNLERPLRVGDELGGHIVAGHVDGVGEVVASTPDHGSTRWTFRVPEALAPFIAPKGSVAVDGVSLTVNEVDGPTFGVNVIPHTHAATTFGGLAPGAGVNIEIDTVARYVARLRAYPVEGAARIRRAERADLAAISALVARAYQPWVARIGRKPAPMLDDYARRIEQGEAWVREASGAIVAIAVLEPAAADALTLDNVAVAPEAQGRGHGRAMLGFAESEARQRGCTALLLYTNALMHENIALYARHGFRETDRARIGEYDRVNMAKALT